MLVQGFSQKAQCPSRFQAAFKAPEGLNDHFSLKKEINSRQSLLSFPLSAATLNSSSLLHRMLFPAERLLAGLQLFPSRHLSANTAIFIYICSVCGVCVCMYVHVYIDIEKYLFH